MTFDALTSSKNVHWFCDACHDPIMTLIKNDRTLKEVCASYMETFRQRLDEIEVSVT